MRFQISRWLVGVFGLAATLSPATAFAQATGENPAAAETTIHGGWLVIAAYIVLWIGLMGYVGWLAWRQSQLDEEIDELERRLDEELGAIDSAD